MKEWIVYHFADGSEYYLDASLGIEPLPHVLATKTLLVFDCDLAEGEQGTLEVTHFLSHLEKMERYRGDLVDSSCIVTGVTAY